MRQKWLTWAEWSFFSAIDFPYNYIFLVLDVILSQFVPNWCQSFAVAAPRGEKHHKMSTLLKGILEWEHDIFTISLFFIIEARIVVANKLTLGYNFSKSSWKLLKALFALLWKTKERKIVYSKVKLKWKYGLAIEFINFITTYVSTFPKKMIWMIHWSFL